jgi:photosystem II stability/assembly factor-like uncharacterized protein
MTNRMALSVGGQVFHRTPQPADELLFGSVNGVVALRREGSTWKETGRALEGLHVSSLVIDPRGGAIVAGTHNGGVHVSQDEGRTWERRDQGFVSDQVYSLGLAEANGEVRLYAGTEPVALYLSTDLGRTWTELPAVSDLPGKEKWTFPAPPHVPHVKHITFDPRNADVVYASIEQGTLAKSEDGGKTWRIIFDEPAADVHRLTVSPARPDWLYMSRGDWSIGREGMYLSKDDGRNWERLNDRSLGIGYPDGCVLNLENPDVIFFSGAIESPGEWGKLGNASTHVARTRDAGKTWQILPAVPPVPKRGNIEAMTMNAWPGGFAIFAGTTDGDIHRSEDEGESWTTIATGLPAVSKSGHWQQFDRRRGGPVGAGAS